MGEPLLDLGGGLQLWRVALSELREQDLNARQMDKETFDRLATTIKRDSRLESLPLLALTERDGEPTLEIVSGHHRTRAARAAGLGETYALVDVTGLTPDQIKAKQLAHNAIAGQDDPQLVKRIYEQIARADLRLEAFVDPSKLDLKVDKLPTGNVDLGLEYKTALFAFVPYELERFERAVAAVTPLLTAKHDARYLAELALLDRWRALVQRTGQEYDIRALGTILAKMAEIVLAHLGEPLEDPERVPLRDLVGTAYLPPDAAAVIAAGIERMQANGAVTDRAKWRALELWAADCLAGR